MHEDLWLHPWPTWTAALGLAAAAAIVGPRRLSRALLVPDDRPLAWGLLAGGFLAALTSGRFSPSTALPGFDTPWTAHLAIKAAVIGFGGTLLGAGMVAAEALPAWSRGALGAAAATLAWWGLKDGLTAWT